LLESIGCSAFASNPISGAADPTKLKNSQHRLAKLDEIEDKATE